MDEREMCKQALAKALANATRTIDDEVAAIYQAMCDVRDTKDPDQEWAFPVTVQLKLTPSPMRQSVRVPYRVSYRVAHIIEGLPAEVSAQQTIPGLMPEDAAPAAESPPVDLDRADELLARALSILDRDGKFTPHGLSKELDVSMAVAGAVCERLYQEQGLSRLPDGSYVRPAQNRYAESTMPAPEGGKE